MKNAAVRIYRHPDCRRCERIAARHRRLDWLRRVDDSTGPPPDRHVPVRKGSIVVHDLAAGRLLEGVEAVQAIFRQVPLYWPLLLLLRIPALARRADADARGGAPGTDCG